MSPTYVTIEPTATAMSDPVDVVIFISSLGGGGAERAMILFARTIQELGVSVEIVCAQKTGPLQSLVDGTTPVIDLGAPRMLSAVRKLRRYLQHRKPKAIYSTVVHANLATVLATRGLKNIKVVLRESNAPISEQKITLSRRLGHRLAPRLYAMADSVIAVSERVRQELIQHMPRVASRIVALDTPVIPTDFISQAAGDPLHPWFALGEPPVILGVGRLHPQKNFNLLIDAFAEVRARRPARLLILGEGPEREKLQRKISECGLGDDVQLFGFHLNPFSFMSRARVFVLSSIYEGMPNVLIQAMALGVPVVSTDCPGGSSECLEGGVLGELVPLNDPTAMSAAILRSLDKGSQSEVAERVTARFGAEAASRKYLSLAGIEPVHRMTQRAQGLV